MVAVDEHRQLFERFGPLFLRRMGIDCACVQNFARRVDNRHFAAGAKARIECQNGLLGQRRLAEQARADCRRNTLMAWASAVSVRLRRTSRSMAGSSRRWARLACTLQRFSQRRLSEIGAVNAAHGQQPIVFVDLDV